VRVKIVQQPTGIVDGIDLSRLVEGNAYDVGTNIGNLLLASRWAAPIDDDEPALLLPFTHPIAQRLRIVT